MVSPLPDYFIHLPVQPFGRPLEEKSDEGKDSEYTSDSGDDSERVEKSLHYFSPSAIMASANPNAHFAHLSGLSNTAEPQTDDDANIPFIAIPAYHARRDMPSTATMIAAPSSLFLSS